MKKHVLIISSYDDISNPYYGGGGAVSIHKLAQKLGVKYQVKVITSKHTESMESNVIDGVSYYRIGYTPAFFPQLGQLLFLLLLPFYAIKNNFDIWLESFTPPFSTAFLPFFTKKPVIGVVHYLAGKKMAEQYKIPFHVIENFGLKLYSSFIVPNDSLKEDLEKMYPKATTIVIPNGVDIPRISKSITQNQIAYIGRISIKQKGLDVLLEAFAEIAKKTGWKLFIGGNGIPAEEDKLKKMLQKIDAPQSIEWLGKVDSQQKEVLFKKSAFVVVPSREETFSLVALEAMSYGKPLITFDIKGLSWIPKQGRLLAKSFEKRSLKQNILKLINNTSMRQSMSEHNKVFSKKYSWATVAGEYQKVINTNL